jgi:hypothetical protein
MKRRSIIKAVLYTLGSIAVILSLSIWIFLSYYFEGTLNKVVIPKIELAAFKATHGRFALTIDKIFYKRGTLVCNTFILSRAGYDSSEHGMVLDRLTLDSARFEGISWWDVLLGNDLTLVSLELNAPKIFMNDIGTDSTSRRLANPVKKPSADLSGVPAISFDSIVLRDISVFLPKPSGKAIEPAYRNITIKLTGFSIDPKRMTGEPALFSKHVDFELPGGSYSVGDSVYSLEVRGIHGSFTDSLVTIDNFAYKPNYSEQAFADRYRYQQGRVEFKCSGIKVRGTDFTKLLTGGGLHIRSCEAASWYVDYYGDLRKHRNPHPPDAVLPNTLVRSIKAPITVDTIIFNNGTIRHRERVTGSTHASLITFTHARVCAQPFSTDSASPACREPLHISVSALFMDRGKLVGTIIYPIHHKAFDLHIYATVGPFDLPVLNSYLVSNERKEVTNGSLLSGEITLDVRSGIGVATVTPRYRDLSLKLLPSDAKKSGGIIEGIKSFIANTFVLRTTNIESGNKKAFSATTTTARLRPQLFFEFIWIALRTSILKVLGY